jgi:signal transduction histidine kinase
MRTIYSAIAGSVSAKILIATLASVICVMSTAEIVFYFSQRSEEIGKVGRDAGVTADRLAFNLSEPVTAGDIAGIQTAISHEMKNREVLAILVDGADGRRIAGCVLHDACTLAPFDPASTDRALLDSALVSASRPIVRLGREIGTVSVRFSDVGLRDRLRQLVLEGVRHTLVLSIVFAAVLFLCIRTIVIRPLKTLEASVGGVAGGDFGVSIPVDSKDEVGRLGSSFNRMVSRLQRLYAEVRESEERLRRLSGWQREAIEADRKRIAREIHDDLAGQLTALRFDLHWIEKRLPPGQADVAEKVRSMIAGVDRTHDVVEHIIRELRPQILDDLGLVPAVEWLASEFEERSGIPVDVVTGPEPVIPRPEQATALFRISQEALTNVARHADAGLVRIRLRERFSTLSLVIRDDGKGFVPGSPRDGSHGLVGIGERVRLAGGRLKIRSAPGRGTEISVLLPKKDRRARA